MKQIKMKIVSWICAIFCFICIHSTTAEIIRRTFKFTGRNKFKFFAKFAFGEDTVGKFEIRGRLVSAFTNPGDSFKLETLFYEDLRWDNVINTDDCVQKKQFKNMNSELTIMGDGSWSVPQIHEIRTVARTRLWYVSAAD